MRRFVIGDIHGCSKTFRSLVDKINLKAGDELYLLGDYINKGPDSKGVLDTIFGLEESQIKIRALRGNHEQQLLDAIKKDNKMFNRDPSKSLTLQSFSLNTPSDIPEKYIRWMDGLPYFYETDHFFLVHAGFDFTTTNPFVNSKIMLTIREYEVNAQMTRNKRIIHGHTPQEIEKTQQQLSTGSFRINLDGGCVFYRNEELARLMAMDLDSLQLFIQKNIDAPYAIEVKF
ncbi:MAG: metallophosphoesterase family protein [Cytophagaceae bacterium]